MLAHKPDAGVCRGPHWGLPQASVWTPLTWRISSHNACATIMFCIKSLYKDFMQNHVLHSLFMQLPKIESFITKALTLLGKYDQFCLKTEGQLLWFAEKHIYFLNQITISSFTGHFQWKIFGALHSLIFYSSHSFNKVASCMKRKKPLQELRLLNVTYVTYTQHLIEQSTLARFLNWCV